MSETPPGVHVVFPAPRDAWNDLLDADPLAVPTPAPAWTDLVCRALDAVDTSRLYEYEDGRRLVLPLVARRRAGLPITEESVFRFERLPLTAADGTLRAAGGRLFRRGSAPAVPEPS